MHITRNSVALALRKMGLPTRRPALPEKEVLALLRKRTGCRAIGKMLHVSQRSVVLFAHGHGYGRPRKQLSGAQALSLIGDILDRRGSAAALAKRHRASYKRVLELAHRLLQCERFLPTWKNPLSSYLPSRPPLPMSGEQHNNMESLLIQLVDKIVGRFLNGTLPSPANENKLIQALSVIVIPEEGDQDLHGCPRDAVRECFETHLHEAIDTLRTAQTSVVN